MKKLLKDIFWKMRFKIFLVIILIALNEYFLTYPSKILGRVIDLISNLNQNMVLIYKNIILLLAISGIFLIIRVSWKYILSLISRGFEKDIKDKLFDCFLRLKLSDIQNIKNGEIMSYFAKDVGEIRRLVYGIISGRYKNIFYLCYSFLYNV